MRSDIFCRSIDDHSRIEGPQAIHQIFPQLQQTDALPRAGSGGQYSSPRPTPRSQVYFQSRPDASFPEGHLNHWRQVHAWAYIERSDSLGSIDLVGREGEQVYIQIVHVYIKQSNCLNGIGMKANLHGLGRFCRFQRLAGQSQLRYSQT